MTIGHFLVFSAVIFLQGQERVNPKRSNRGDSHPTPLIEKLAILLTTWQLAFLNPYSFLFPNWTMSARLDDDDDHRGEESKSSSGNLRSSVDAKIVLLGDSGVGKTSLAVRYARGIFTKTSNPTIGASFLTKTIVVDQVKIKQQIWDTAGQERFRSLAPMYYRGARAAILVYDITQHSTFERVQEWVRELQANSREEIVLCLVGNKSDMTDKRAVTYAHAKEYAESIGAMVCETSAMTNAGVDAMFLLVSKELAKRLDTSSTSISYGGRSPPATVEPSKDKRSSQPSPDAGACDGCQLL